MKTRRNKPTALYRKKTLTEIEPYINGMEDGITADGKPYIATLEGDMLIHPCDWIATGINGERWPIKDEIFRATYEKVEGTKPMQTLDEMPHEQVVALAKAFEKTICGEIIGRWDPIWDQLGKDGLLYYVGVIEKMRKSVGVWE